MIWKQKSGKTLPVAVVKELIANRKTEKPVSGFRGRSGRTFSARLKLEQTEEGKWRVDFDEEWARQPRETNGDAAVTAETDGAAPARGGRRRSRAAASEEI